MVDVKSLLTRSSFIRADLSSVAFMSLDSIDKLCVVVYLSILVFTCCPFCHSVSKYFLLVKDIDIIYLDVVLIVSKTR